MYTRITKVQRFLTRITSLKFPRALLSGLALILIGSAASAPDPIEFDAEVADAFGLTTGHIVSLDFDRTAGVAVSVDVPIGGREYTLDLNPHSVRADGYKLLVQVADGTIEEREPGIERTMRGTLRGIKGSRVAGSMLESGLAGKIVMGDGTVFFIEPLASKLPERDPSLHVVYAQSDTRPHDGRCGVLDDAKGLRHAEYQLPPGTSAGGGGGLSVAELGCDADFEYYTFWGSNVATVEARINLVIDTMNMQYETEVDITHLITAIIVRTAEPDPYSSTDACTLLDQFQAEWLNNQGAISRDVAQLFTGKEVIGSTVGLAFIGVICNIDFHYGWVQSDFAGSLACATDLSAHELGHNWDAEHCTCPSHTMNPFITCLNTFNPVETIPEMIVYRNTLGCLDGGVVPPPNDNYFGPQLVLPFNETGTNVNATTEPGEQQLENTGSTVWWFFVAPADGFVTVDTCASNYDTQLHIYEGYFPGATPADLTPVVNNDDFCGLQSQVTFPVTAGTCYDVRVGGFRSTGSSGPGDEGNIILNGVFNASTCDFAVGDINGDGFVNLLDVDPFVFLISNSLFQCEGDINEDGFVNLLDVDSFVALLAGP